MGTILDQNCALSRKKCENKFDGKDTRDLDYSNLCFRFKIDQCTGWCTVMCLKIYDCTNTEHHCNIYIYIL